MPGFAVEMSQADAGSKIQGYSGYSGKGYVHSTEPLAGRPKDEKWVNGCGRVKVLLFNNSLENCGVFG